jgi:hypothetical protein
LLSFAIENMVISNWYIYIYYYILILIDLRCILQLGNHPICAVNSQRQGWHSLCKAASKPNLGRSAEMSSCVWNAGIRRKYVCWICLCGLNRSGCGYPNGVGFGNVINVSAVDFAKFYPHLSTLSLWRPSDLRRWSPKVDIELWNISSPAFRHICTVIT